MSKQKQKLIIAITSSKIQVENYEYDYSNSKGDRILQNIHSNEYEVFYSGQNQGQFDNQLEDAVKNKKLIKIFYRKRANISFTYLGETNISSIIQNRNPNVGRGINSNKDDRLQIHMVVKNPINDKVPDKNKGKYSRYKRDILDYVGTDIKPNLTLGFFEY